MDCGEATTLSKQNGQDVGPWARAPEPVHELGGDRSDVAGEACGSSDVVPLDQALPLPCLPTFQQAGDVVRAPHLHLPGQFWKCEGPDGQGGESDSDRLGDDQLPTQRSIQ